ncbi:hypothetical protein KP79_PYT14982 [Mizuhopecten yessoensis]|uniref:SGNH hydrolase-type esterase domain-containing protein n=1 Tax=Mizuhopecten yessoensis TaxID=6573 RepID=A0A210PFH2_MIZYE|nr:hypothetical protein KP79_PYT14982 [Mizuhopecten yessoensis]
MKVVIIGHSFVRRLRELVEKDSDCANLRLETDKFQVNFRARGGLTVHKLRQQAELLSFNHTDLVFLQIGGNDLSTLSPYQVAHSIFDIVEHILNVNRARHVVVGQLFWRSPEATKSDLYNDKVVRTNLLLSEGAQCSRRITFWRHRGFWKKTLSFLSVDGVHLHVQAQRKYLQSVKAAILTVAKTID